jgi:hypothetical protein
MRYLPVCVLAVLLAACGDLSVQSVPGSETIPAALEGEWRGNWRSTRTQDVGAVTIRIQEFAGQPVVSLTIDNPCLAPADYDLVLAGGVIALQADGVTVLEASLARPDRLTGTFGCALDEGTWAADLIGPLPEPIDLSGSWEGRVFVPGAFTEEFGVTLQQSVRSGRLARNALADIPGVLPFQIPMRGYVVFGDDDFDIILETEPGVQPQLVLSGSGDRDPLAVPTGVLQVLGQTPLPFSQGLVELEPR